MTGHMLATFLLSFVILNHTSNAEHDFNFNDSQMTFFEPKKELLSDATAALDYEENVDELSRCNVTDRKIYLSLVLLDWQNMDDNRRAKLLDKLSNFFAISKRFITLESLTKHDFNEMVKEAIRKGNNKSKANIRSLGRASFLIGCGYTYFSAGKPVAHQISHQMKDKSIENIIGEKFGWWVIWRQPLAMKAQRMRRQIEGSGENYEYTDDYDYEDEQIDVETEIPSVPSSNNVNTSMTPLTTTTTTTPTTTTTTTTTVATTAINTESSTPPTSTPTHPHRHHHGQQHEILDNVLKEDEPHTNNKKNIFHKIELDQLVNENNEKQENKIQTVDLDISKTNNNNGHKMIIDEEIVESVSQLESVIKKTIQNTQNIDELPIKADQLELPIEETYIKSESVLRENDDRISDILMSTTMATTTVQHSDKAKLLLNENETAIVQYNMQQLPRKPIKDNSISTTTRAVVSSSAVVNAEYKQTSVLPTSEVVATGNKNFEASESTVIFSSTTTATPFISSTTPLLTSTLLPLLTTVFKTNAYNETTFLDLAKDEDTTLATDQDQPTASVSSTIKQMLDVLETTTVLPTSTEQPKLPTISSVNITENSIENVVENMPPMIKTRLQKFAVTSGKLFSYFVTEDTFVDQEDKSNLRLQFTHKNGDEISTHSWLQFNAETHEIYGLPLEDSVSRWQYRLSATDSGNETVTETVELTVQQHRGLRSVNHEIMITLKLHEMPTRNIDWQVRLVHAIASALGDNNTNALVVREIRPTANDPLSYSFVYFNETLPNVFCPEKELSTLIKSLQTSNLQQLVSTSMTVKEVSGQLIGACLKTQQPPKPKPTFTLIKHAPPQPRNQVDRVNATAGHLLVYKVPADTFYDDHDLKLTLRTKENMELSPRHWLQFDSKNQEFYGIPKSIDTGTEEYLLVAENTLGLTANDALVVVVNHAMKREYIVYFKAYLGIRHEQFNAELQRKFVERLAALFGDSDTQYIQIRSVTTQHDADSTIVNFYNTTLYKTHHLCPQQQVDLIKSVYLLPDNTVRDRVKQALGAELNLTNLQTHNLGSCYGHADVPPHREYPTAKAEIPTQSTFGDNYMITIIYPAVIIVTMIIIASLIACCVHRRRHKSGKMELGDEEERKSFRTRGIPVIFQDELDEKPELGNKSPIILKNEKPPLLPPTYTMNGENDVDEYVPPPAVVLGGREVRGKSPATPSYRKPPPYVSP